MGSVSAYKIVFLAIVLVATSFLVYGRISATRVPVSKAALDGVFTNIGNWAGGNRNQLDSRIADELQLDDYLFKTFALGPNRVTLYIGYYRSAAKVGAAHDPLVCFNGQGWRISKPSTGKYQLVNTPAYSISYSSMVAERNGDRELIVYWFQTRGHASSTTLMQKIDIVRERLGSSNEDNAFIRLSTSVDGGSPEKARRAIFAFVEEFYPILHRYMTGNE